MKGGARIATAVVGGYILGRFHKTKWALLLAGMAVGRKLGSPGQMLQRGSRLLESNPELGRLTQHMRGRLTDAGKTATIGVLSNQLSSLTDRIEAGTTKKLGLSGTGGDDGREPAGEERPERREKSRERPEPASSEAPEAPEDADRRDREEGERRDRRAPERREAPRGPREKSRTAAGRAPSGRGRG